MVGWLPHHLLRRHISECPHRRAGTGKLVGSLHRRQPEINNPRPAVRINQYVRGFDVTVRYALLMRCLEPLADLDAKFDNPIDAHFLTGQVLLERAPFHVRHGKIWTALVVTDFIDRDNVGMIQFRGRLGLALEARPAFLVVTQVRWKELQRDLPVKLGVLGQVHLTHPT